MAAVAVIGVRRVDGCTFMEIGAKRWIVARNIATAAVVGVVEFLLTTVAGNAVTVCPTVFACVDHARGIVALCVDHA